MSARYHGPISNNERSLVRCIVIWGGKKQETGLFVLLCLLHAAACFFCLVLYFCMICSAGPGLSSKTEPPNIALQRRDAALSRVSLVRDGANPHQQGLARETFRFWDILDKLFCPRVLFALGAEVYTILSENKRASKRDPVDVRQPACFT